MAERARETTGEGGETTMAEGRRSGSGNANASRAGVAAATKVARGAVPGHAPVRRPRGRGADGGRRGGRGGQWHVGAAHDPRLRGRHRVLRRRRRQHGPPPDQQGTYAHTCVCIHRFSFCVLLLASCSMRFITPSTRLISNQKLDQR